MLFFYSVKKKHYEELIVNMIKSGNILDHSKSPCEENFIPEKKVSFLFKNIFNGITVYPIF